VDQLEFSQRSALHVPVDTFDILFAPDEFSVFVAERSDHKVIL